jgi:hypothetical protein
VSGRAATARLGAALLLFSLACAPTAARVQNRLLAPYATDARVGGSVRALLRAHPNHRAGDRGAFWFETVGPENVRRIVRLRGEGDRILWLQVQDEPLAPKLDEERARFEAEVARIGSILGRAAREGNRLSPRLTARWALNDREALVLSLDLSEESQTARRGIAIGEAAPAE